MLIIGRFCPAKCFGNCFGGWGLPGEDAHLLATHGCKMPKEGSYSAHLVC